MAQGGRDVASLRLQTGDAPLQGAETHRVLGSRLLRAILLEQRIHPPRAGIVVFLGQQQAVERREFGNALADVVGAQHAVHELRRDPVEECEVEQQRPVLRAQPAEQTLAEPIRRPALLRQRVARKAEATALVAGAALVAVDAQRHRPALGAPFHRTQFLRRQLAVEEALDLLRREAQILGAEDAAAFVARSADFEAGVVAHRQREMQVRRPVLKQEVHRVQRFRVAQLLHVVESEQARRSVGLDGGRQHLGATPCAVGNLTVGGPRIALAAFARMQPGELEGIGEIGIDHPRSIVRVQRQPCNEPPLAKPTPTGIRKQTRLAEAPRRLQNRQPPQRLHPGEQIRTPTIPLRQSRPPRLGVQQPRTPALHTTLARHVDQRALPQHRHRPRLASSGRQQRIARWLRRTQDGSERPVRVSAQIYC